MTAVPDVTAGPAPKRLLVVGMHNSPHLHRWVAMVARPDTAILVFPVLSFAAPMPDSFVRLPLSDVSDRLPAGVWVVDPAETFSAADRATDDAAGYRPLTHSFVRIDLLASPETLSRARRQFRPHLLHGLETQLAGYLCAEMHRRAGSRLPPWVQSVWGSDIALYRKLPGHAEKIEAVCRWVALLMPDCARDDRLAREMGYRGPRAAVIPTSGGIDVGALASLSPEQPSARRRMLIKGNHNWAGRGRLALSALTLAQDRLRNFAIDVVGLHGDGAGWVERLRAATGLTIEVHPYTAVQADVMAWTARARAVLAIGISDGSPTTMLEAMAVGTLPIQSCTACAEEWLEHGVSGLIVSPHDTRAIAGALIRAATDDALVERAARLNRATVASRWDIARNGALVWEMYDGLIQAGRLHRADGQP